MPDPVASTFGATGQSAAFTPDTLTPIKQGRFNLTLSGTFVATVRLERSFDAGSTWHPCTVLGRSQNFTAPCSEVVRETEAGVQYRLNCTAYTSGTVTYRLSQ